MSYKPPTVRTLVLTAVVALFASAGLFVSRPIDVVVDGTHLDSDVPPMATGNQVYVPVRSMANALGASTFIEPKTGKVVIIHGSDSLKLHIGNIKAQLDGMPMTLDHAPFVVRGRVMVALHTIARAFGVRTSYDAIAGRIDVMTPGIGVAPRTGANITGSTQ
jgi:hypothetical protein